MDGSTLETELRRVIILGGNGRFGRTIAKQLQESGINSFVAARRGPVDLRIDANDLDSVRSALTSGDLVMDAAGPYQTRTMALLEAAIETGFDVIDLNDSLDYALRVLEFEARIASAGIRVLSSASSVSAVAAAVVRHCGCENPVRVTTFLAPASRHTANRSSALSLVHSVGAPIRIYRDGKLTPMRGWSEKRPFRMPSPLGDRRGGLFESADAVYLPRIWPTLRDVAMYVDSNTPGVNGILDVTAKSPLVRRILAGCVNFGTQLARIAGSSTGGLGYEIEELNGVVHCVTVTARRDSFFIAVAPAILAARAILAQQFPQVGLVPPDLHVRPMEIMSYLRETGIEIANLSDHSAW